MSFLKRFTGYRTYIIASSMILFALVGLFTGWMSKDDVIRLILEAAGFAGLRAAIK